MMKKFLCTFVVCMSVATAEDFDKEIFLMSGNDQIFNSDGGGLTASFAVGGRYKEWTGQVWGGGYTPEFYGHPEYKDAEDNGPFNARITVAGGRDMEVGGAQSHVGGYLGMDGVNHMGESVQCDIHSFWGNECPNWPPSGDNNHVIAGGYGYVKSDFTPRYKRFFTQSFAYSSLGSAAIHAGFGGRLAWLSKGELPIALPDNGLYGVDIEEGDGVSFSVGSDFVGYDQILEGRAQHVLPYVKLLGQLNVFEHGKVHFQARCQHKSYQAAPSIDCFSNLRLGVRF